MPPRAERTLCHRLARWAAVVRRVLGAPDYEAYLAHVRVRHAGDALLTREEFTREMMSLRYERPGGRCC